MSRFMKISKKLSTVSVLVFAVFAFSLSFFSQGFAGTPVIAPSVKKAVDENYGNLPLYFIKNEGMMDENVSFYENGKGHSTFLTNDSVYMALIKRAGTSEDEAATADIVRLRFLNANASPVISPEALQEAKFNYFIGEKENWRTDVPSYGSVLYKGVYDGVDMRFYGNSRQFEYDMIVSPGVDPSVIRLAYEGLEGMSVNSSGDLEMKLAGGTIIQKHPIIYQEIDGKRVDIEGSFAVDEFSSEKKGFSYGFNVASYDREHPLIIDPVVLTYASFIGGSADDIGWKVAVDSSGNAYIAGETMSSSLFPLVNAYQSSVTVLPVGFISKVNPAGNALVYSTYLGGNGIDRIFGLALDSSNNVYVTGQTRSTTFPTTGGAYQTAKNSSTVYSLFVTKLNSTGGALDYSTFVQATTGTLRDDSGYGIAVDSTGNAYVTGRVSSQNFPTAGTPYIGSRDNSGFFDAIVLKLNSTGTNLIYSTFLGGTLGGTPNPGDYGYNIAIDSANPPNAFVTGWTNAPNFPTVNAVQGTLSGTQDAFVTKVDSTGSNLLYSTFLGGTGSDFGVDIGLDDSGNAYVVGIASTGFPTLNAYQASIGGGSDAFLTKLTPAGALSYSTFIGGSGNDQGWGITVEGEGFAIITGNTNSTNFPTINPVYASNGGGIDAFVFGMNPDGTAEFSSYYGGTGTDKGYGVVLSGNSVYLTGETGSANLPTLNPFDTSIENKEAFIAKFTDQSPYLNVDPWSWDFGSRDSGSGAGTPKTFTISNQGSVNLVITNMALTGANTSSFVFNVSGGGSPCGTTSKTLAPAASCTVTVAFSPQSATTLNANLTITSNDPIAGSTDDIGLTGVGTAPTAPDINVTPSSKNYGTVLVGVTSDQTFTIQNLGTASLSVTSIGLGSEASFVPDYVVNTGDGTGGTCGTTFPKAIAASSSCTVTVTFQPQSSGSKLDTLLINSNSPGEETVTVNLSGMGQTPAPEIDVTPTSKAFGNVQVGSSSTAQDFNIANSGTASLTVTGISITGTNAGDFSLDISPASSPCGSTTPTVGAGNNCNVEVTCDPLTAGAKTANLTITSNDSDESTLNLALTCTGTSVPQYLLTVSKAGTGAGTVTSSPAGIDCGGDCTQNYDENTVVTLTAAASTGSIFSSWTVTSGTCTGSTSPCTVTMAAARNVTASFAITQNTLTYTKAGTGSGTVVSSPAGINSASSTTADFNYGTTVTLTATPATGSTFTGWSGTGGCTGTGTCVLTMTAARAATATFTLTTRTLTYTKAGTGSGTVVSSPAGINSASSTTADFNYGTTVTLTATPATGSTFTGWSGAGGCTGTGTCVLIMTEARAATATFTLTTQALTVTKAGTGLGTVTSTPAGISCGATCAANFNYGTTVTLTAAATSGSTFTGWSGAGGCTGTGTCILSMTAARAATATFTLNTPQYTLTVSKAGNGICTVTSSPSGINCGGDCTEAYDENTSVTLTAAPGANSFFSGWSGAGGCTGTGTCVLTMTAAKAATATCIQGDDDIEVDNPSTGTVTNIAGLLPAESGQTPPAGVSFPDGLIEFDITGVVGTGPVTIDLTFPTSYGADALYYKVTGSGFVAMPKCADVTPATDDCATISGNTVSLTLHDGGTFDTNPTVGTISDPGGPGEPGGGGPVANYGGGSSSGCFIATAAYGSYQEPHVWILRQFRDKILLTNRAGEAFVKLYYRTSPPLADYISRNDGLRAVTRTALLPLYGFAQMTLALGPAGSMAFFGMIFTLGAAGVVIRRRRRE